MLSILKAIRLPFSRTGALPSPSVGLEELEAATQLAAVLLLPWSLSALGQTDTLLPAVASVEQESSP